MQRDDFVAHVATYYVPSNTVLSVAGNTTHAEVLRLAEKLFGDMPRATAPETPAARRAVRARARGRREARDRAVQHGHRAARAGAQRSGPLSADGDEHDPRPRHEFAAVQGGARAARPRLLRRLRRRALQRHRHHERQRGRHAGASRRGDAGDPRRALQAARRAGARRRSDEGARLLDRQLPPRPGIDDGAGAARRRSRC